MIKISAKYEVVDASEKYSLPAELPERFSESLSIYHTCLNFIESHKNIEKEITDEDRIIVGDFLDEFYFLDLDIPSIDFDISERLSCFVYDNCIDGILALASTMANEEETDILIGTYHEIDALIDSYYEFVSSYGRRGNNRLISANYSLASATAAVTRIMIGKAMRSLKEDLSPVLLLHDSREVMDPSRGLDEGVLEIWMLLTSSKRSVYRELNEASVQLWSHDIIFLHRNKDNERVEIGHINGMYILPFIGSTCANEDSFYCSLDADSQYMNDVWKVIMYQYLPKKSCDNIVVFCHDGPFEKGFMTIEPVINEPYRGNRIASYLFELILSTFEDYPNYSPIDVEWINEAEDDEPANIDIFPDISTPSVFIFPVAGTEPEKMMRDIRMAGSSETLAHKVVDIAAEAKKRKLNAYFLSLSDELNVDIEVYDPFEYPNT